jgi:hypothetical protein
MGLLDDAIRDHLELKRLRGADPGEVAREQREALEPVLDDEDAMGERRLPSAPEDVDPSTGSEGRALGVAPVVSADATAEAAGAPETAGGSEETAELDMQSVLDRHEQEPEQTLSAAPAREAPADGHSGPAGDDEDSLEWEVPGGSPA